MASHIQCVRCVPTSVNRWYAEDAVNELGALILRHGMEECCGVWRVHKHFELSPGEHVVSRLTQDEEGRDVLTVKPEAYANSDSIPTHWRLNASASTAGSSAYPWEPMQFMAHSPATSALVLENLRAVLDNHAFLQDYTALLLRLGVADRLGLYVCYEGLLDAPRGIMEDTDEEQRVQTLFPYNLDEKVGTLCAMRNA